MRTCDRCGGYSESRICPACLRNDQLLNEQKRSKQQFQHESHVKEISKKLLELALESVENPSIAKKKVKVIIKSAVFSENERDLFSEIQANSFLADCYFLSKLGLNPTLDSIRNLSSFALHHIPEWAKSSEESSFSKKVLNLYLAYKTELDAEQKRQEEEKKRSEQKRKRQEAKEGKEDQDKQNEFSDFFEQTFGHRRSGKTEDIQKNQTTNRSWEYTGYLFFSLLAIWLIYSAFSGISNFKQSQIADEAAQQEMEQITAEYRIIKNRAKQAMRLQSPEQEREWEEKIRKMEPEVALEYFNNIIKKNPY